MPLGSIQFSRRIYPPASLHRGRTPWPTVYRERFGALPN